MDFADRPVIETKQDGRCILGIDFEPAQLTAETGDCRDLAEHPADVVDFMNGIENHAAPEISASTVTLTVILLGVPIRQILTYLNARGNHAPNRTLFQKFLDPHQARVKTHITAHQRDEVALRHRRQQAIDTLQTVRKGFLNKQVTAVLGSFHGQGDVQPRRNRDQGNVGSGLDGRSIAELLRRMQPLAVATPPLSPLPKMPKTPARLVTWIEPRLAAC